MKRSCKYCGRYHETSFQCGKKPARTKKGTNAEKFRRTSNWKKKSIEIRTRDKGLCQYCLRLSPVRYTFEGIEVHHIVKLETDMSKGLDNGNLISLCKEHHIQADAYEIDQEELHRIAEQQERTSL